LSTPLNLIPHEIKKGAKILYMQTCDNMGWNKTKCGDYMCTQNLHHNGICMSDWKMVNQVQRTHCKAQIPRRMGGSLMGFIVYNF